MGIFDSPADAPFQIKNEGETITLTFSKGTPTSSQGTVNWNIPSPVHGCQTSNERGAYAGIVILLSNEPLEASQSPKNGITYVADHTGNADLHMGDKINGALVVGAVYECDKVSNKETLTTSIVINDLEPSGIYYVAGYAVDCQKRYHTDGVRAYSDDMVTKIDNDTPSTQVVTMEGKVSSTDGTGLIPGLIYQFDLELNTNFPEKDSVHIVNFSEDGINLGTYGSLIDAINREIALVENPPMSPIAPDTGRYYWNSATSELSQWTGTTHAPVPVMVEASDPSSPQPGDYWYNQDTSELHQWDTPIAGTWNPVTAVSFLHDPTNLPNNDSIWFDGSASYRWCSGTWCSEILYITNVDPSLPKVPQECGEYWFDTTDQALKEWDSTQSTWIPAYAIVWDSAPTNISPGEYWFDDNTETLHERVAGSPHSWRSIPLFGGSPLIGSPAEPGFVISVTPPANPVDNLLWVSDLAETLARWDESTSTWNNIELLVWPHDPTDVSSCDLWWNSSNNLLYKWDIVHQEWDIVTHFSNQSTDPLACPSIAVGSLWHDPTDGTMRQWDGVKWLIVQFMQSPTDPTQPTIGSAWIQPNTNIISIWGQPSPNAWNEIDPINATTDPFLTPQGTLWFNTTTNNLLERIGTQWISLPYSTQPLTPQLHSMWFDTTLDILMEWNGTAWLASQPLATASINTEGNIQFVSTFKGSNACLMILIPEGSTSGSLYGELATGTAGHDFAHYGYWTDVQPTKTLVSPDQFLFDHLTPSTAHINRQTYGTDGISPVPSYDEISIGDDGSPDERRELVDSIRAQLGYPVVDVELTPYQINTAIDLGLESLRKRSSSAYKRGFFFLDMVPGQQHYSLTNKTVGFNTVVTVMSAHRFTSAFLSSAHGSGVYGQVVLQHLYNMGTFDLLSFHLVSQYVEQMEMLFATRLTFNWNEDTRMLSFYNSFASNERVLLDVMVERTEQEIFKDRWTKTWVEKYALAESMKTLSHIRGKYATLPGAGGGVSLNAADLITQHDMIKDQLYMQIDDMVVNSVEDVGLNSTMIIG